LTLADHYFAEVINLSSNLLAKSYACCYSLILHSHLQFISSGYRKKKLSLVVKQKKNRIYKKKKDVRMERLFL
jgi:hypothetical protein